MLKFPLWARWFGSGDATKPTGPAAGTPCGIATLGCGGGTGMGLELVLLVTVDAVFPAVSSVFLSKSETVVAPSSGPSVTFPRPSRGVGVGIGVGVTAGPYHAVGGWC